MVFENSQCNYLTNQILASKSMKIINKNNNMRIGMVTDIRDPLIEVYNDQVFSSGWNWERHY